jgi:hypothetical protein
MADTRHVLNDEILDAVGSILEEVAIVERVASDLAVADAQALRDMTGAIAARADVIMQWLLEAPLHATIQ